MKRRIRTVVLKSILCLVVVIACGVGEIDIAFAQKWPDQIIVGAFPKGADTYPVSVGLAMLISKYTQSEGLVREYAGGTPSWKALMVREADTWGIAAPDTVAAYYGEKFWQDNAQDLVLLTPFRVLPTGFGVRAGEGIRSLKDLAGKRCMVLSPLDWESRTVEIMMRHEGVWDKATVLRRASIPELVPAMIDKKIDCFYSSVGAAYTLEIKRAVGIDWIALSDETLQAAIKAVPGVTAWTAPERYLKMYDYPPDKKLKTLGYTYTLAIRKDMADHVAYGIMAAFWDKGHPEEVASVSPHFIAANIQEVSSLFWIPYHPGSVKYLKDRGLWTGEMEKRQMELLSKPRKFPAKK